MIATYILGGYMLAAMFSYTVLFLLSLWWDRRCKKSRWVKTDGTVTLLAPTTDNDAAFIVSAVKKFLNLPVQHVVVVVDGGFFSLQKLLRAFPLMEVPPRDHRLKHERIRVVWQTRDHKLTVLLKNSNRSKGDAVNAGLEYVDTSHVLVCDADSVIPPNVIPTCLRRMQLDNAVACGIPLRPANRKGYWAFIQTGEYYRAFQLRSGWAALHLLSNISGGCGIFNTRVVREIGYNTETCAEDLVMCWSLLQRGYRVTYEPGVSVTTEVPATHTAVKGQRERWSRGLHEALAAVPPRGRFAILWTFLVLFEVVEPFAECLGLCWLITHHVSTTGWIGLAVVLLSTVSLTIQSTLERERMDRQLSTWNILKVCAVAVFELVPMKLASILWRMTGTIMFLKRDRTWQPIARQHQQEATQP